MEASTVITDELWSREELRAQFGPLNYAIFFLLLLLSALIGVLFWWKGQKSTKEFLLANGSMGVLPMTLSLLASFMSAITLLGLPAEIYLKGTQ